MGTALPGPGGGVGARGQALAKGCHPSSLLQTYTLRHWGCKAANRGHLAHPIETGIMA